ncbi:Uncharacterised protein [Vibrio cholerae]|nr:Uncharacterised protein [Vibrio cholerae]
MQGVGIWHGTNILCEYHGVTCTFFCLKFHLVHFNNPLSLLNT